MKNSEIMQEVERIFETDNSEPFICVCLTEVRINHSVDYEQIRELRKIVLNHIGNYNVAEYWVSYCFPEMYQQWLKDGQLKEQMRKFRLSIVRRMIETFQREERMGL